MKDNRIYIRVSTEEKKMLQEQAGRDGRSLGNYLIHLANQDAIRQAMETVYGKEFYKRLKEGKKMTTTDLKKIAREIYNDGFRAVDSEAIQEVHGISEAEAEQVCGYLQALSLNIRTHPDGGKLALYDDRVILDWADYEDTERIKNWEEQIMEMVDTEGI